MAFLKPESETFESNVQSETDTLRYEKSEENPRLGDGESNKKYETSRHGQKYDEILRTNSILPRL